MFGSATQDPDGRTASQELTRMGFLHAPPFRLNVDLLEAEPVEGDDTINASIARPPNVRCECCLPIAHRYENLNDKALEELRWRARDSPEQIVCDAGMELCNGSIDSLIRWSECGIGSCRWK